MDTPDGRLGAVARLQWGCFTADQAAAAGFSPRAVRDRVGRGIWLALYPGVYCAATSPATRARAASAARLRVAGSVFSDFTAARLLGVDLRHGDSAVWLQASATSGHRGWAGVRVTRTRHPVSPVLAHGQPVVPVARTIVDLAARLDDRALTGALYDVIRRRVVTADQVAGAADAVGGGRAGLKRLRRVLETLDPAHEAMVESLVATGLAEAGIMLTPQVEVWDGPQLLARLDLADEVLRLGVEVDGFRYHGSRDAQMHDKARDRALRTLGWTIVRFDAVDALDRLASVVRDVAAVRRRLMEERRRAG